MTVFLQVKESLTTLTLILLKLRFFNFESKFLDRCEDKEQKLY